MNQTSKKQDGLSKNKGRVKVWVKDRTEAVLSEGLHKASKAFEIFLS